MTIIDTAGSFAVVLHTDMPAFCRSSRKKTPAMGYAGGWSHPQSPLSERNLFQDMFGLEMLQPVSLSFHLAQLIDMRLQPPSLCLLPSPLTRPPAFQIYCWKTLLYPFRHKVHNWKVFLVTKWDRFISNPGLSPEKATVIYCLLDGQAEVRAGALQRRGGQTERHQRGMGNSQWIQEYCSSITRTWKTFTRLNAQSHSFFLFMFQITVTQHYTLQNNFSLLRWSRQFSS